MRKILILALRVIVVIATPIIWVGVAIGMLLLVIPYSLWLTYKVCSETFKDVPELWNR